MDKKQTLGIISFWMYYIWDTYQIPERRHQAVGHIGVKVKKSEIIEVLDYIFENRQYGNIFQGLKWDEILWRDSFDIMD